MQAKEESPEFAEGIAVKRREFQRFVLALYTVAESIWLSFSRFSTLVEVPLNAVLFPFWKPYGEWTVSSGRGAFSGASINMDVYKFQSPSKTVQKAVALIRLAFQALDIQTLLDADPAKNPQEPLIHPKMLRWRIFAIILHIWVGRKQNVEMQFHFLLSPP